MLLLQCKYEVSHTVFELLPDVAKSSSTTSCATPACAVSLGASMLRERINGARCNTARIKHCTNQTLHRKEGLLEPMLRTVHIMVASTSNSATAAAAAPPTQQPTPTPQPSSSLHEPLVYYCGAMKNCSNDAHNQRALIKAGALHVLCSALGAMAVQVQQQSNGPGTPTTASDAASGAALAASGSSSLGAAQVAVQITGVLRNLAVVPAHAPSFLSAGALPALKAAAGALPGQQELVLNIGRVLCKLSLSDTCQVRAPHSLIKSVAHRPDRPGWCWGLCTCAGCVVVVWAVVLLYALVPFAKALCQHQVRAQQLCPQARMPSRAGCS